MKSKPFFSIVIPTHKRPDDLKVCLKSIMRQDFKNFEIVISDNSPDDKSEKIFRSLKDTRIRYYRNPVNIGFARNLYLVIKKATGSYVFILGDDDFILDSKVLSNVAKLLKKENYGFVRLKLMFHNNFKIVFDMNQTAGLSGKILPKNSSNWEIIDYIHKADIAQISGLIFKNSNLRISEIEKATDPDFIIEIFWVRFIFEQVKKYGAYVDGHNSILMRWIIQKKNNAGAGKNTPSLVAVINNRLYMEKSWELVWKYLNARERKRWVGEQTEIMIPLLPSVKFYSDNTNLLRFGRRMAELNPKIKFKPSLYFYTLIGLFMPKPVWNFLRGVIQNRHKVADRILQEELKNFVKQAGL